MHVRCLKGQLSSIRHGVPRVHGEIDDGDFQLIWIGVGTPQTAREHRFNCDLLADRAPQKV